MFVLLTDATTGKQIVIRKSLISLVYTDTSTFNNNHREVTRIDFTDALPSEWVEESIYEVYKQLMS